MMKKESYHTVVKMSPLSLANISGQSWNRALSLSCIAHSHHCTFSDFITSDPVSKRQTCHSKYNLFD